MIFGVTAAHGQSGQRVIAIACRHFRNEGLEHAVCRDTVFTNTRVFNFYFAAADCRQCPGNSVALQRPI